jgi:hypothetical protein
MGKSIAVVVPTCRPELYQKTFLPAWQELFDKHNVCLLTVFDHENRDKIKLNDMGIREVMGKNIDLIYNRNAGIKNVGFACIAKNLPEVEYIIALDDDVKPIGDPIQDHIDVLNARVPISWMPVGNVYTRGFPYGVRQEAEVVLSHGVWDGCPDLDAPTQLIRGNTPMNFFRMPIPKGVYYPMCEMNIAFKRKMLPYMYLSPASDSFGFNRNDDIWCGIESKREIDKHGWAVVTGCSTVYHERASNIWASLKREARFIELNETYWQGEEKDPYFKIYREKRRRWEKWLKNA